jgi:glycosyltransferase involved in cell wall biosynthesis
VHVLFYHPNFPAQFGHVADHLARRYGWRCTFVSERPAGRVGPVELIQYRPAGGATPRTHFCSRTFENAVWHSHAAYEALKARPDVRPDLVVGHSGFGSTCLLRELYPGAPVVNYFEYFYRPTNSDLDFRPDFPPTELHRLRARMRNAALLIDLEGCDLGYSPTRWQRDRLPVEFRHKVRVAFDGVDTRVWRPQTDPPRRVGGVDLPAGLKVVSYATRGMESMRGFDLFMKAAKILCDRRRDVVFVVAGQDRVCYGGDERFTGGKSFKQWVLSRGDYDLSRFVFTGLLPPAELARLFALTDLHVYLTVPFVLSWSLFDALACGATVLASDTGPVREVIEHGRTGLLWDFFDAEGLAEWAMRVLDDPGAYRPLGRAGVELVRERYGLDPCLSRLRRLYEEAARAGGPARLAGRRSCPPAGAGTGGEAIVTPARAAGR